MDAPRLASILLPLVLAAPASARAAPPPKGEAAPPKGEAAPAADEAAGPAEPAEGPQEAPPATGPGTGDPPPEAGPSSDAAPTPEATPAPAGSGVDPAKAQALRAEADEIRQAIFDSRARVATLTRKLFRSHLAIELRSNLPRFYKVQDLVITVDGAPVYERPEGMDATGGPLVKVFAAPGVHRVGISANLEARRDPNYTIRFDDTYALVVPADSAVSARIVLREAGNMWRLTKRGRGQIHWTSRLRVRARKNKGARGATGPVGGAKPSGGAKASGGKASVGGKASLGGKANAGGQTSSPKKGPQP